MLTNTDHLTIDLIEDDRPERFTGTPPEIISRMNATAFSPCENPQQFMARWNYYYGGLNGRTLRTETAAAFVEDLIGFGLARRVEDGNQND